LQRVADEEAVEFGLLAGELLDGVRPMQSLDPRQPITIRFWHRTRNVREKVVQAAGCGVAVHRALP
jgi:hypothetical protein